MDPSSAAKSARFAQKRYPMVLAGFVIFGGLAFAFRKNIMGDLTEQSNRLYASEDMLGTQLISQQINDRLMK